MGISEIYQVIIENLLSVYNTMSAILHAIVR